jgi:sec-independent protein translocase protein TatC
MNVQQHNDEQELEPSATEQEQAQPEDPQSFFSHLEELRKRIMLALLGVLVGCLISGIFVTEIMDVALLRPATVAKLELQNLRPFGQAFLYFKVIFVTGIIIAMPYVLYQLWLFIAPGLYEHERSWARQITFFTTLCFAAGISFAYFIMIPTMLKFAAGFGSEQIKNIIDITEYFGFVSTTLLAAGVIFELPMISFVLARVGMLSAAFMRQYRRHAMVIILILAAVLTPTPDPVNQLIFAVPLWFLYEISIFIVKGVERRTAVSQS